MKSSFFAPLGFRRDGGEEAGEHEKEEKRKSSPQPLHIGPPHCSSPFQSITMIFGIMTDDTIEKASMKK